jgi:UDP-N-acetyl-D-mannosaminuronate dehydrogenase
MWKELAREKVLVVGLGEIGRTLFDLLKESGQFTVFGFDMDNAKMREIGQNRDELPSAVDVMQVCLPCSEKNKFISIVAGYAKEFNPKLLIINSTVPPGTTLEVSKNCNCLVVHSPIRGVHKSPEHMKWELKRWTKYIGGVDAESAKAANKHFQKLGLKTKVLKGSLETELAKLFETTYRAWMIAFFQEMHRVSRHFGADFDGVVDFLEDTHRVRFDRPIMFPDVVGGHCIIPNVELLLKSYDSRFLRLIEESNEKRKKEIEDKSVREEVEKVRERVEAFQREMEERRP